MKPKEFVLFTMSAGKFLIVSIKLSYSSKEESRYVMGVFFTASLNSYFSFTELFAHFYLSNGTIQKNNQ
jgi:hypothetical protein